MNKKCYIKDYFNLRLYAKNKYNLKIVYSNYGENLFIHSLKVIFIDKKMSTKKKLFTLSHEIGHAVNLELGVEKVVEKSECGRLSKSDAIKILTNEIKAWDKARKVLEDLNIDYCKKSFDRFSEDCINTYVLSSIERTYGVNLKYLNLHRKV